MVLSVFSGAGAAIDVQRGGTSPEFNPGPGGPQVVTVDESKPVVFQGEDNVNYQLPNGSAVDTSQLIGVAGDAEGQPLEANPIPQDFDTGQYTFTGESNQAGVTVSTPRVTDMDVYNERGVDVRGASVQEDEVLLVKAEWNYKQAEDLSLKVTDENGNDITGDVVTNASGLSDSQQQLLTGPYATNPELVQAQGQQTPADNEPGLEYLQGLGQLNETDNGEESLGAAYWAIDLSDEDTGDYNIQVEGWDDLTSGPAVQSGTISTTAEEDVTLNLDPRSATQGENVAYGITGSTAGATHYVTIESDDFRNDEVDERVFRTVDDVVETGSTEDFAYAQLRVSEDTGIGQGSLDTTYLDDTSVDVNLYGTGQNLEDIEGNLGDYESQRTLNVEQGDLAIQNPSDTYIAGSEIDVNGTASQGIDDVALYARDQGDWELVDINEDGEFTEEDVISVDAGGEWEQQDVTLSDASDILSIPGTYRFGVIEAQDAREGGNVSETLTTSEFGSGTSFQTSLEVEEPELGGPNATVTPGENQTEDNATAAEENVTEANVTDGEENVTEANVTNGEENVTDGGNNTSALAFSPAEFSVSLQDNETEANQTQGNQTQDNQTAQNASNGDVNILSPYQTYNDQIATEDGVVDIDGNAPGQEEVLAVMIDSRGRVATQTITVDQNDRFEQDDVALTTEDGQELNEGNIEALVIGLGRDDVAGDGELPEQDDADINGLESYVQELSGQDLTQVQVLARINEETIDDTGSDDLALEESFRYADGETSIQNVVPQGSDQTGIQQIPANDTMVISGITNRKPDDTSITIEAIDGPSAGALETPSTDTWNTTGQWSVTLNTTGVQPGNYTLQADDGDTTDTVEVQIGGADNQTAGDGQAGDGQAGDGQAGDGQAGNGQAGDGQMGDGQAGDGQQAEGGQQGGAAQPGDEGAGNGGGAGEGGQQGGNGGQQGEGGGA